MMEQTMPVWEENKRRNAEVVYGNKRTSCLEEVGSGRRMIATLTKRLQDERKALAAAEQALHKRWEFEQSVRSAGVATRLPALRAEMDAHKKEIRCLENALAQEGRRLREAEVRLRQVEHEAPEWLK